MGFQIAPAIGSSASVSDHVMTCKDYIKKMILSGLDVLALVLQSCNNFDLNSFFKFCLVQLYCLQRPYSIDDFGAVCSNGLFGLG